MAAKVLIIDDEEGVRKTLSLNLGMEGYEVESVEGADTALNLIDSGKNYDFIISDIRMPGTDGIQFLKEIKGRDLGSIVIMISAYGTVETSIEAIKCGASDYVNKPINTDELFLRMRMDEERERLRRENLLLRKGLGKDDGFEAIVFTSDKMGGVVDFVKRVSEYKTTVLITGESGTGKELIAHAIHARSPRKDGAFVAINCSAIPESLLESELFGYVKGAFSGASQSKRGLFERAMILCDSNSLDRVNFNLKDNNIQGDAWFDSLSLDKAWQKLEKAYIEKALLESGGNRTQAAKLLGLSRRSLLYKLKQYGYSEEED